MNRNSQLSNGEAFRARHSAPSAFVMPCAWDVASATLFRRAGFDCIGTTSGGVNWSAGRPDYVYAVAREVMLDSYAAIASAVDLPVSGDLENGYGATPGDVAETIRLAIDIGLVGGSIEDQAGSRPGLLSVGEASERVVAAREAADATEVPFTLTARAESYFGEIAEPFADAVERANRYREAGADCIFVPGPADLGTIARLVQEIDAPISVGIGSGGGANSLERLSSVGVRRVSTGGAIPRALYAVIESACDEMRRAGTFSFADGALPETTVNGYFGPEP